MNDFTDPSQIEPALAELAKLLEGDLHVGETMRRIYATDASAYQEVPLAVCLPKSVGDLQHLIRFANDRRVGLIPRAAGTSLAGQVVGSGIVVDVSRHFTQVLEVNQQEGWVRVQPGVIRNELNMALKPHGLLFGPETSTQNRAMMGGMLGNNSCGSNSVKYGSVRDHVLEVTALLSDGALVTFGPLSSSEFSQKCDSGGLEGQLYRDIRDMLQPAETRAEITREFPKPSIPRRNTGYALDLLMDASCFQPPSNSNDEDKPFHFGKLIAGSEGTLCLVTEMKLRCLPLPPAVSGLQCAHFESVDEALRAVQIAVKYDCYACELIDRFILDCTKRSPAHCDNRFFVQGDPGAILVTELRGDTEEAVLRQTERLESELRQAHLGHAFPVLFGDDTVKIWDLRKAGLGLMNNAPGDLKPASVIEDTAVSVDDLPEYIAEFNEQLRKRFGLQCVQYAHAGSGEIHLRPVLNLKTSEGVRLFREVAECVAMLVKKYQGSLSGEHGDGRLRGEFLEQMIGSTNYALVKRVKASWDPHNIFNPGKIVDTPVMNTQLRNPVDVEPRQIDTVFDWSSSLGIQRAAEMCTGSGDCRKTHLTGGVMCPSYMATRNEQDTTRARANLLRQVIVEGTDANPFDNEGLKDVLDLCMSCKGCKRECPSSVDMAKLKAEFQQHYYDAHGAPWRAHLIARFASTQRWASWAPWLWNLMFGWPPLRRLLNRIVGFHPDRTIPSVAGKSFRRWQRHRTAHANAGRVGAVHLFADEFSNYTDTGPAKAAVELLERLGYQVIVPHHVESGRSWISKGFIRRAKRLINENLRLLGDQVTDERPLVGVEPSAILTFRDEAIDLADSNLREAAKELASNCFTLEEFIAREAKAGRVRSDAFTDEHRVIHVHGHCFQKALSEMDATVEMLQLPSNYEVKLIPSGCCGMAGSFGYEREHWEVSQQIGELVLFPAIRQVPDNEWIAAAGTSCRHQIWDGVGRRAMHPAEVLLAAWADQDRESLIV